MKKSIYKCSDIMPLAILKINVKINLHEFHLVFMLLGEGVMGILAVKVPCFENTFNHFIDVMIL